MGFKQKYSLDPKEQRRARVKMQITIYQYDFYAGPEENEPLKSDGS